MSKGLLAELKLAEAQLASKYMCALFGSSVFIFQQLFLNKTSSFYCFKLNCKACQALFDVPSVQWRGCPLSSQFYLMADNRDGFSISKKKKANISAATENHLVSLDRMVIQSAEYLALCALLLESWVLIIFPCNDFSYLHLFWSGRKGPLTEVTETLITQQF